MKIVRVDRTNPEGPRVFIYERRVHHWQTGAALILAGILLVWDDRKDVPRRKRQIPYTDWEPTLGVTTTNATEGTW